MNTYLRRGIGVALAGATLFLCGYITGAVTQTTPDTLRAVRE